jgi:hypothetical protein
MNFADAHGIRKRLESLGSATDLRSLFIEALNYEFRDQSLLPEDLLSEAVREPVQELRIVAGRADFHIILCTLDRLLKTRERPIAQQLTRTYYHALVVFTDPQRSAWHFCNLKHIKTDPEQQAIARRIRPFRRMVVGETERLRTTSEQMSKMAAERDDTGLDLHLKMDEAFDVEAVSRRFYKDFVYYYKEFRDGLMAANDLARSETDIYTQTIFNRLLFLYFVQKRGFLDGNPRYLYEQFRQCPPDVNYYQGCLVPLFRRLSDSDFDAPELGDIPFLNGGLFEFDPGEETITVQNEWFEVVYEDLLERYNFTVREDTEFEQEVAVDPEMLGTVFEQLILGLESREFEDIPDPRRASGSYYTPKFVVAFMVKESLMAYLQGEIPDLSRGELKRLIYNLEPGHLPEAVLEEIRDRLTRLKAVDPGVGSGAFPVGLLLKMVEVIRAIDEERERESTESPRYRYELKRKLIERCIYGVDIQERAVHLSELRLWLSLLIEVPEPEPLPNLDLHIMTGDSLVSRIGGTIDFNLERQVDIDATGEKYIDRYKRLKTAYETVYDRARKEAHRTKIEGAKRDVIRWFLETRRKTVEQRLPQLALMDEVRGREEEEIQERRQELKTIESLLGRLDELTETFNWGLDFSEIMTLNGGFDLVIGNPPYGVKVPRKVQSEFRLGSRDSYGVFTALGLTILRTHGTLCYIMSDTWQTIGSHKELRDQLLTKTDARYLLSVPNDTFKATVNPGVYVFRKRHPAQRRRSGDNWLLAADFSPLSIADGDVEVAFELLAEIDAEGLDESSDGHTLWSDREMAIFAYRQKLIPRFSNYSFFIASPKLFRLMRDVGNVKADPWVRPKQQSFLGGPEQADFFGEMGGPSVYSVDFNGKELELVNLGDIADVVVGLQTGDNDYYIRQSEPKLSTRNYPVVDRDFVVDDEALGQIAEDEAVRLAVIQVGLVEDLDMPQVGPLTVRFKTDGVEVHDGDPADVAGDRTLLGTFARRSDVETPEGDVVVRPEARYLSGRYFVPYDKGGASDIDEAWLPNYFVPTDYFIDWSERAVDRLRTLTIADRIRVYDEGKRIRPHYESTTCAVLRNTDYYFRTGISYSRTGQYCPTFRLGASGIFDTEGCAVFSDVRTAKLLAVLPSRLCRFLFKNFIDHTVHLQVEDVKKIPLRLESMSRLCRLVEEIVEAQRQEPRYDYMTQEQVQINSLIYELYNLTDEDIAEVENWFWRRYPKLARAIERNQRG